MTDSALQALPPLAWAERLFHWPVGSTPADRAGTGVPSGWTITVGFAEDCEPRPGHPAIHTGLDLNLRSGGDSDLDEPVYAVADGIVTASGGYRVWGNIVMIAHPLPDGGTVWSQYAHLGQRLVPAGKVVRRGDPIGTVGKGEDGRFSAHLHFELRARELRPAHWPGPDRDAVLTDYRDPAAVIRDGMLDPPAQAPASRPDQAGGPDATGAKRRAPGMGQGASEPGRADSELTRRRWNRAKPMNAPLPPLNGKGLFVERLWEIETGDAEVVARRARGLGLGFAVACLGHGERAWHPNATAKRTAAALTALQGAGVRVWGWSTVLGAAPTAEAELILERHSAYALTGWVLQPLRACPDEALDQLLMILRGSASPPRVALLTDFPDRAEGTMSTLAKAMPSTQALTPRAAAVDVLMPRIIRLGDLGVAMAGLIGDGRPIVPVLDLRQPTSGMPMTDGATLFLDLARGNGRPGAGLMTWEHCQAAEQGPGALAAVARFTWPAMAVRPDHDRGVQATARSTAL